MKMPVQIQDLTPNVYVIVELIFNENTRKEVKKQLYAIVQETKPEEQKAKVKFFRPNQWEMIMCSRFLMMRWTLTSQKLSLLLSLLKLIGDVILSLLNLIIELCIEL